MRRIFIIGTVLAISASALFGVINAPAIASLPQASERSAQADANHKATVDNLIWNTFLGGSADDSVFSVSDMSDGSLIVLGTSYATWGTPIQKFSANSDVSISKIDTSGQLMWNTFLGGVADDSPVNLFLANDGSIIVVGISKAGWGMPITAYTESFQQMFVVRLSQQGDLLWHTFIDGHHQMQFHTQVIKAQNDDLIFAGDSEITWGNPIRLHEGGNDVYIARYDSEGNLLWNSFLGGFSNDVFANLAITSDDGLVVTGYSEVSWGDPTHTFISSSNTRALFVAKLDSQGALSWNTFLGNSTLFASNKILISTDGYSYIADVAVESWGNPIIPYSAGDDISLSKIDPDGNLIWNAFLGGVGQDYITDLQFTINDDIVATGNSNVEWGKSKNQFSLNLVPHPFIAEINSLKGDVKWNAFLGAPDSPTYSSDVLVKPGRSILFSGNEARKPFAMLMDAQGNLIWKTYFSVSDQFVTYPILENMNEDVVVAGSGIGNWGNPIRSYSSHSDVYIVCLKDPTDPPSKLPATITPTATLAITETSTAAPTPTETATATPTPTNTPTVTSTAIQKRLIYIPILNKQQATQ